MAVLVMMVSLVCATGAVSVVGCKLPCADTVKSRRVDRDICQSACNRPRPLGEEDSDSHEGIAIVIMQCPYNSLFASLLGMDQIKV